MARIRKIPDTWTHEIHAIVLKDSRQAEHEEIGCMNTTKRSSVYSNIKRGGRGAQKKETHETTRHDKTKLRILKHQTWWERSSKGRNGRNNKTQQDGLSILEHQRWWEKSSKRKETLETTRHNKTGAVYSNTNAGGRGARNKKKRSKQKDTTRRSSADSNIKRGGRGAQKEGDVQRKGRSNVGTIMAKRRVLMDLF